MALLQRLRLSSKFSRTRGRADGKHHSTPSLWISNVSVGARLSSHSSKCVFSGRFRSTSTNPDFDSPTTAPSATPGPSLTNRPSSFPSLAGPSPAPSTTLPPTQPRERWGLATIPLQGQVGSAATIHRYFFAYQPQMGWQALICNASSFGSLWQETRRLRFVGTTRADSSGNHPVSGVLAIDDIYIASVCTNCQTGQYQNLLGRSECAPCTAGMYCESRGLENPTGDCLVGTYSEAGFTTCADCPPGTWEARTGQPNCTNCVGGKYSSESARLVPCVDLCSIGRYSPPGSPSCPQCLPGQYQPDSGSEACIACLAGQFSAVLGAATVCTACISGRYNDGKGAIVW